MKENLDGRVGIYKKSRENIIYRLSLEKSSCLVDHK